MRGRERKLYSNKEMVQTFWKMHLFVEIGGRIILHQCAKCFGEAGPDDPF